jgi:RimJ/RimL family protein N-acetyltransferase
VILRPLTEADAELLVAQEPQREERIRRRIAKRPTLAADGFLELGIEVDGRLVGDIQARTGPHAFPPGVCEIGITLFPDARGRGIGLEAVRLFTELLVREHGIARVQASTALDNVPMRRVLERLGWTLEGVLEDFYPDGAGGRLDYALYAITARRVDADRVACDPGGASPSP